MGYPRAAADERERDARVAEVARRWSRPCPGPSLPLFSASQIIAAPMRHFTE
jgi:hypothetical protein